MSKTAAKKCQRVKNTYPRARSDGRISGQSSFPHPFRCWRPLHASRGEGPGRIPAAHRAAPRPNRCRSPRRLANPPRWPNGPRPADRPTRCAPRRRRSGSGRALGQGAGQAAARMADAPCNFPPAIANSARIRQTHASRDDPGSFHAPPRAANRGNARRGPACAVPRGIVQRSRPARKSGSPWR